MKTTQSFLLCLAFIIFSGFSSFGAVNPLTEILPRFDSRDGNSVDTANGAFIQEVNLVTLQGARPLSLDISYNSLLTRDFGDVGLGWTHQYEANVFISDTGLITVRIDGNHAVQFTDDGDGNYTPFNLQSKYNTLRRFNTGEWELGLQSGTKYFFSANLIDGRHRVISIQNRNRHPVSITYVNEKPGTIEEGISGKQMFLFYQPSYPESLQYVVHGSDYTFLKYDRFYRLSRIYDPTRLKLVGSTSSSVNIPFGAQGITYPVTVTASETDRLIRLNIRLVHTNSPSVEAYITSPAGKTVQIRLINDTTLFLDDFVGEDISGNWSLKLIDNTDDGTNGFITSFSIRQSTTSANWTQYDYEVPPFHRLTRISDSKGNRLASNSYDSAGRVVFQDDGRDDNGAWRFEYEPLINGGMLTKVYDRTVAANKTTYLHDSDNRLRTITDAKNNITQYSYQPDSLDRSKVTDARGNSIEFTYDAEGHGFLTEVKEANGAITKFAYDESDIQDDEGNFDGGVRGNLTSVIDALNNKSTFTYEQFNNLASIKNALGLEQSKTYDSNGQLVITVNKDFDGVETAYTNGLPTSINILNGPETKFEYDGSGRLIKIIDADGNPSSIVYDLKGNVLEKSNALGEKILTQYDHQDRIIVETGAEDNSTTYEYDGNSNLVRIVDALGYVTEFEYDHEDRLIRVADDDNNSKQTTYNALGQVYQRIDELGRAVSYTYDEVGNQVSVSGPTGVTISQTTYNSLNLPISQTDAYGNTTSFEYDLLGQLVSKTDAMGKKTILQIDALGRVDRVTDPLGRTYQKVFTDDDALEKILDAAQKETKFTYTAKNEVETITTPLNLVTTIEYTGSGFISRYIPPSGKGQENTYNEANRLSRVEHLASGGPDIVYTYDKSGNVTVVSNQDTANSPVVPKITRSYDELNRIVSNTDAEEKTIGYTYNAAGLVEEVTYPDGKKVTYTYDAAKRLESTTDWNNRLTLYSWNIHNRLDSILFPNGTRRAMSYDDTGRLLDRSDFDAKGSIILSYEYEYDKNGFVSSERLRSDPVIYEPATSTFVYDDDNRVTAKNGVPIGYDNDGNITTGPVSGQSVNFEWDAHNNLKKAGAITFDNDVDDRLVGWVNGSETVTFTTVGASGGSQILVSESSLGKTTRYVYGVGLAYAEVDGEIKVFHYDERGNTAALSSESGATSGTLAYSPYGEIIDQTGDTDILFKYGGLFGVVTAPNGMNYMRYRWYSPEIMRFISIDSSLGDITLPGSLNRYSFAGNNPINFVDPEGEFLNALIGGVVGSIVGATVELVSSAIQGKPVNWNNVAAAAIGGAIQGAFAGAGLPGVGGALGSITEDLASSGFNGETVDFGGVAVGAVTGFATGKIGGKLGQKVGRKFSRFRAKSALKKAIKKGLFPGEISIKAGRQATSTSGILKSFAIKGFLKSPFKVTGDIIEDELEGVRPVVVSAISGLFGRTASTIQSSTTLPTVNIGRGGEYLHNQRYLEALSAADRPLPDAPLAISSF